MNIEKRYEFRKRLRQVHQSGRRDPDALPRCSETVIDGSWVISYPSGADGLVRRAARDLQDYFGVSMGVELRLQPGSTAGIHLTLNPALALDGSFELTVTADGVTVAGKDSRGVIYGGVYLEDVLNLREAPFLEQGSIRKEKLVTPRMVHSGWGIDAFPDDHLNAIVHAGFDTIVVFIEGIDRTTTGRQDINDMIDRAELHGLDTMFYGYLPGYKHPDESDAAEFFADIYTRLFNYHPKARGIMLVGESAEFPSKDPATTGKNWRQSQCDGIPDPRPSPGWWPCEDYPRWLAMVRDAVRRARPDAMIIFNTYNWGWAPLEQRRKFLENLPEGIIIQATFEMFKEIDREGLSCAIMDYTISTDEPGYYFTSEAETAHSLGIPLLATANTAGMTWDVGCIPYVPTPRQWIRKFRALDRARTEWGVSRYYDNHHYGWWPSVITDLARWNFWAPQPDLDDLLEKLAVRDFGAAAAPLMLRAWDKWSEAIRHLPPTNEDQYGPFRVGPSYPLIFHPNITRTMADKEIQFPTDPQAHFGHRIIKTFYQPYENINQAPGSFRFPVELCSLNQTRTLWSEGIALMEQALPLVPARKRGKAEYELNLGRFILTAIVTGIHVKTWWLLNTRLLNAGEYPEALRLLDEIEALAVAEIANAESAVPLVEADSRLGWEPSMEYVTDRWHLEWKIRQVRTMIDGEIAAYRKIIRLRRDGVSGPAANPGGRG
jgi:hypothetical protein